MGERECGTSGGRTVPAAGDGGMCSGRVRLISVTIRCRWPIMSSVLARAPAYEERKCNEFGQAWLIRQTHAYIATGEALGHRLNNSRVPIDLLH